MTQRPEHRGQLDEARAPRQDSGRDAPRQPAPDVTCALRVAYRRYVAAYPASRCQDSSSLYAGHGYCMASLIGGSLRSHNRATRCVVPAMLP